MTKGIARSGWDIDFRDGSLREQALENLLRFGTYELKRDYECQRTGNLFVEFEQKGKPSGIAITEAQCWATEFRDDCYLLVPSDRMKAICRTVYQKKGFVKGGDYDNYRGVLVPWQELLK